MLEDVAAVEVTVLIEMIMDRGMGGGEFLQGPYISELRHRSFSSPERLVGVFGSMCAMNAQPNERWGVRCCASDEGGPLGTGLQERVPNRLKLRG